MMHECDEHCITPCPNEGLESHQTEEHWEISYREAAERSEALANRDFLDELGWTE